MLIDTHCHLDFPQYDDDRDAVVERAHAASVKYIVNPGTSLETSRRAIQLSERYAGVYAAVGIHPNESAACDDDTIAELRQLAQHPKVVAIGEIGLDYYWDRVAPEQQRRAFELQLALADELQLPVIIHNRDAADDVAEILRSWLSDVPRTNGGELVAGQLAFRGVLHAFSGGLTLAEEAYTWGFVLSLGGPVTFQNARRLRDLVPRLRLDRLMLETDGPYLTPHPHRGRRNEPAYLPLIAAALAELYQVSVAEIAATTTDLALRFWGITVQVGRQ